MYFQFQAKNTKSPYQLLYSEYITFKKCIFKNNIIVITNDNKIFLLWQFSLKFKSA